MHDAAEGERRLGAGGDPQDVAEFEFQRALAIVLDRRGAQPDLLVRRRGGGVALLSGFCRAKARRYNWSVSPVFQRWMNVAGLRRILKQASLLARILSLLGQ